MVFVIGILCVLRCVAAQDSSSRADVSSNRSSSSQSAARSLSPAASTSTSRSRTTSRSQSASRTRHPHSGTPSLFSPSVLHHPSATASPAAAATTRTRHPQGEGPVPNTERPRPHHRKGSERGRIVAIVFGVLGGLVGVFLLYTLARCLFSWRRTPERDRIQTLLDRHYLGQEMEQREREAMETRLLRSAMMGRSSMTSPPPPPYQPAPAYDAVVGVAPTPHPPPNPHVPNNPESRQDV